MSNETNPISVSARRIRARVLRMVHDAGASHVGSALSMVDILAVLYGGILRVDPTSPRSEGRDRLLVSKGHGAAGLYATLAEFGFFPESWLKTYCQDGAYLAGHVTHYGVPGVELSTGSLGHGLSVGCGMALAARGGSHPARVFVLMSDGECDEGSNWEAALFAHQHRLENLIAIIDYNKIQSFGRVSEVMELEPFADKWRSFGWNVRELDGHDHSVLAKTFAAVPVEQGRPTVIIAHTVKGKGVSFMENTLLWHYRPPDASQLAVALAELEITS